MTANPYSDIGFIRSTFHDISRVLVGGLQSILGSKRVLDDVTLARFGHGGVPPKIVHGLKDGLLHSQRVIDGLRTRIRVVLRLGRHVVKVGQVVLVDPKARAGSLAHGRACAATGKTLPGGTTA